MNPINMAVFCQSQDPDLLFVAVMHFFQHCNQDEKGNFWLPILDPSSGTSGSLSQQRFEILLVSWTMNVSSVSEPVNSKMRRE